MISKCAETNSGVEIQSVLEETTVDSFHQGAFKVLQPKNSGHRSGMDALLLAASIPENAQGILADLGAGVGVAGYAALNLNRDLDLLAVEKNPQMAELARRSLMLDGNANMKIRTKVLEVDITANGAERLKAGLNSESVSHVIMNPPYNMTSLRPSPDLLKAEAYMLGEGGIDAWFRTAASILTPGGNLCMIYRTENLGDILACAQGRFGGLEIMPIHSRCDEAAKRLIVRGTRGSRAPLSILPGFVVHKNGGGFTSFAEKVFNGETYMPFAP
ncbi:MAG: tRNA1(Val) (adenine(37)-N6)-methyltransferase [Rhizobiaceae bacterium]